MLRIGLVGCGTHANWAVIPAIRHPDSGCELVAAADVNAENLARVEGRVAKFIDHRAMLRGGGLDAVYVATLADSHAPIALDALAAGLHVICEKPMAPTAEECRRMVEAAERAGRILAVNFETRYYADHRQVRAWIREGRLGRVEAIHIQHFWDGHKTFGKLAARRHRLCDLAGAMDCGIHKADIVRYLVGGEWSQIHAMGRWFGEGTKNPPHTSILASLDNGVMVTLSASFAYTAQIEPRAYSDVLTIVGADGVINAFEDRDGASSLKLTSKTLTTAVPLEHGDHAQFMVEFLRDVASRAAGQRDSGTMATGEDGLQAQILVEEANRQAVTGRALPKPAAATR